MDEINNIDDIILQYRNGPLSEKDKTTLMVWLAANPENEKYFREMLKMLLWLQTTGKWKKLNPIQRQMWNRINPKTVNRKKRLRLQWIGVAAMITLLLGSGYLWFEQSSLAKEDITQMADIMKTGSGSRKAMLELSTGEHFVLSKGEQKSVAHVGGINMIQDSTGNLRVERRTEEELSEEIIWNTISVPLGGEYMATLSDGTKIWINSGSKLTFPNYFKGDKREITLDGEAYLEVVSNPDQPFYVKIKEGHIQVLGTAFNVMCYEEDPNVQVALLRGKVNFDDASGKYIMAPGEIVTLNKATRETHIRKGDVEAIIAWKSGRFDFEDMPLEELVKKLERWYDVKFIFADEDSKLFRFTGAVTKYRTLDYVLNMITKTTSVSFSSDEKVIIINSR